MKTLVTPTVNLNGTPQADLMRQYMDILEAARNLSAKLQAASPHGRDYPNSFVTGENLVHRARDAWRQRLEFLHKLHTEIESVAIAVQRQGDFEAKGAARLWQAIHNPEREEGSD